MKTFGRGSELERPHVQAIKDAALDRIRETVERWILTTLIQIKQLRAIAGHSHEPGPQHDYDQGQT
jgi:hypothetical protein